MKNVNKQIKTEIVISASSEIVWKVLVDFNRYHEWNPFIIKSNGEARTGNIIINTMKQGDKEMTFKPRLLKVETNKCLEWKGSLFVPGLFDGVHRFKIETLGDNQCKLIQSESFSGLLSKPILKSIKDQTIKGFVDMNNALKERVENNLHSK